MKTARDVGAATFNFYLAACFIFVWSGGGTLIPGSDAPFHFVSLIVLELGMLMLGTLLTIGVIHLNETRWRIMVVASALIVVLGLVATWRARAWWPVSAAIALIGSKMRLFFRPPSELDGRLLFVNATVPMVVLFLLMIVAVIVPVPAWGVGELDASYFSDAALDDGREMLFRENPQNALALGAVYFAFMGLFGHALDRGVREKYDQDRAAGKTEDAYAPTDPSRAPAPDRQVFQVSTTVPPLTLYLTPATIHREGEFAGNVDLTVVAVAPPVTVGAVLENLRLEVGAGSPTSAIAHGTTAAGLGLTFESSPDVFARGSESIGVHWANERLGSLPCRHP